MRRYVIISLIVGLVTVWTGFASAASAVYSWTAGTGQTGIRVERQVDGGTYAPLATLPANATTYTDTTVTQGKDYCFQSIAFNTFGAAAPGAIKCGSTKGPTPTSGGMLIINFP